MVLRTLCAVCELTTAFSRTGPIAPWVSCRDAGFHVVPLVKEIPNWKESTFL